MQKNQDKKQKKIDQKVKELNSGLKDLKFGITLEENKRMFLEIFKDVGTLRVRDVRNRYNEDLHFCLIFCDGVTDKNVINQHAVKPLVESKTMQKDENLTDSLMEQLVFINSVKVSEDIEEIIESVTYGETLLLADGLSSGLLLETKGFTIRSISEPSSENVLSGPREGFNESLMTNLSMLHRKLRTNEFKIEISSIGKRTHTMIGICYIDSIVNKKILDEIKRRISKIDIDGIIDSNYISEIIKDKRLSPYRTIGFTERPDVVAAKLLEGRIAIVVDGTPVVLTAPYLFIENFQSNEDYYLNFIYTTFMRILRIVGYFLTVLTPAIYISIVAYQIEILPPALTINIASAQENVPLPAAVEAFVMLIVFDLLKETGVRMPSGVGQTLSIVGALVIGQAAVEAKLVSAPLIIVIAFSGLTNLLIPKLAAPALIYKYVFLAFASFFGLFGVTICLSLFIINILMLTSFGMPQLISMGSLKFQEQKDNFFRAPWDDMEMRPSGISSNLRRMGRKDK